MLKNHLIGRQVLKCGLAFDLKVKMEAIQHDTITLPAVCPSQFAAK